MNTTRKDDDLGSSEAAALWRRARNGLGPQGVASPDALTIAAYVDGTLDSAARDQVEAWMASSPEALDLVIAARSASAKPTPPAPARLVARACRLVGGRPAVADSATGGVWAWLAGLTQPSVWAAATAAMLLAAVVSFEVGREATVTLASAAPTQADDSVDIVPSADDLI
jgi:anti-sigma factor RsiW